MSRARAQEFADLAPTWEEDEHEYLVQWARARLLAGDFVGLDQKAINALTRATLTAGEGHTFGIVDWSGIEARVLAWAANDTDALAMFRTPGADPYRVFAGRMFNCTAESIPKSSPRRQLGKIAELGLGYGMGTKKFRQTAEKGGVDWAALDPLKPGAVVKMWREIHAPIVQFWRDIEAAAMAAAAGEETEVGPTAWAYVDGSVWCYLASGRPIVYRDARVEIVRKRTELVDEDGLPLLDEDGDPIVKMSEGPTLQYASRRGREDTYGGKLCENVIQALAREFLAIALVKLEAVGIPVVFHVHDETVARLPLATACEDLKRQEAIMCEVPDWAAGCPIGVEGFLSRRYRK